MKGRACLLRLCVPGVNGRLGLLEHCDYLKREKGGRKRKKEERREGEKL